MRFRGESIAIAYCLQDRIRTALYITGYDPVWKSISPGTLLIAHALEDAANHRSVVFDFLRGDEPYKTLWGAAPTSTSTLVEVRTPQPRATCSS
jgi:CelD/BcsL family acetyltransferase involved in cellulose biosynthesis